MTRWAMVADLRRCVGCQTCTAACKHANATAPGVMWRKVLDMETGEYPDVKRAFVPVGCMHCADPPCMHVCPSTATRQRADGIVTIDYDICIGCAYCAVACPYQARYKVQKPSYAYGPARPMASELQREDPARFGVAQKCTFCADRIDDGLARGLTPGIDPDATPACVNACIADALHFGDLDDPESNVSVMLRDNASFRMHEHLQTSPGFHYLWDGNAGDTEAAAPEFPEDGGTDMQGVSPWQQIHWDWRAAGNFILGGTGTGLFAAYSMASLWGLHLPLIGLLALVCVALGLGSVWLEIGRKLRALNVYRNANTSWMTREAMAAMAFLPLGMASLPWPLLVLPAAMAGLLFLYCQGRILQASKGIPVWRLAAIVPLVLTTGLAEGPGLLLLIAPLMPLADRGPETMPLAIALLVLLAARALAWHRYLLAAATASPSAAFKKLATASPWFLIAGHILPVLLASLAFFWPPLRVPFSMLAGFLALAGGWAVKALIITGAAYNQGYAIPRTPSRGSGGSGLGARPGWKAAP